MVVRPWESRSLPGLIKRGASGHFYLDGGKWPLALFIFLNHHPIWPIPEFKEGSNYIRCNLINYSIISQKVSV